MAAAPGGEAENDGGDAGEGPSGGFRDDPELEGVDEGAIGQIRAIKIDDFCGSTSSESGSYILAQVA